MKIRHTLALFVAAAALSFSAAISAQSYEMQQQPPSTKTQVTDQELGQFVEAQVQISSIQQDFSGRLQKVEDPERAHELQVQANEEMTEAVEQVGLDVESYNSIATAIQSNPELQQRLNAMMQEDSR